MFGSGQNKTSFLETLIQQQLYNYIGEREQCSHEDAQQHWLLKL